MNNLSTYILEKLSLSKDSGYKPQPNDKVLMIINQTDRNSLDKKFPKPHAKNCFLKVSKIKEVKGNSVIVPFYRRFAYSNEKPELLEFKLVETDNLHFAKLIDDYDKDLHGVVLNKEAALDYINDWMKTGKGVLKYDLDGKEYRVWKDENYPMKVWLDNIKQGLLD